MWDAFIARLIEIYCEPAFVVRDPPQDPIPFWRAIGIRLGLVSPHPPQPRRYFYKDWRRSDYYASQVLSFLRSRGAGPAFGLPRFGISAPFSNETLACLQLASRVGNLVEDAASHCWKHFDSNRLAFSGLMVGRKDRFDCLLRRYASVRTPHSTTMPEQAQYQRELIFNAFRSRLESFFREYAGDPPARATINSQTAMIRALSTLSLEEACDDVFLWRCFVRIPRRILPSGRHSTTDPLEVELCRQFDTNPDVLRDGENRFLLYASYLGGLNVVQLSELINSPIAMVGQRLHRLWMRIVGAW